MSLGVVGWEWGKTKTKTKKHTCQTTQIDCQLLFVSHQPWSEIGPGTKNIVIRNQTWLPLYGHKLRQGKDIASIVGSNCKQVSMLQRVENRGTGSTCHQQNWHSCFDNSYLSRRREWKIILKMRENEEREN